MSQTKSVKEALASNGVTIREWAAYNGFSENLVYAVLNGKNKASRGESYRIAVALGLRQQPDEAEAPSFLRTYLATRRKLLLPA